MSRKLHPENEIKESSKSLRMFLLGIALSIIVALFFSSFYGAFRKRAEAYRVDPTVQVGNISMLYESAFLLYNDLYNQVNGTTLTYPETYFKMQEGYSWLLDAAKISKYINDLESSTGGISAGATMASKALTMEVASEIEHNLNELSGYLKNLEESFIELTKYYDYCAVDHISGKMVTNMSAADIKDMYGKFLISFQFDENGNVSVGEDLYGRDEDALRRLANAVVRSNNIGRMPVEQYMGSLSGYGNAIPPRSCSITFSISEDTWNSIRGSFSVFDYGNGCYEIHSITDNYIYSYRDAGIGWFVLCCYALMVVVGYLSMCKKVKKIQRKPRLPWVEVVILGGAACSFFGCFGIMRWAAMCAEGELSAIWSDIFRIHSVSAIALVDILNLLLVSTFLLVGWCLGSFLALGQNYGIKDYIQQKSLIYRVFPSVKKRLAGIYEKLLNLDLSRDAHRTIIHLLIVNGIILLIISSLWLAGLGVVLVYSVFLYFFLRKYASTQQKRYGILFKATNEIAKGNLNVTIEDHLGVFEPFKAEIIKIEEGFKNAVEQEVKSQRLKTELISNVSHDLKTPLTAIITYINLLKEKNITEEQRAEYLDTLERKSLRLKVLIEDLFEVSKASSQNVTLNLMNVDIMNLVKQVSFEMSDKLAESGLDVRLNLPEGRVVLPLDSQKTYRVYENLFANIAKYALPGTRVYVGGGLRDGCVEITLKNITAQEITVDSTELTERFVRNDASRNTEGSGLGLAIAKSFMEIQGGNLKIEVDGDLFKVTTRWPLTNVLPEGAMDAGNTKKE